MLSSNVVVLASMAGTALAAVGAMPKPYMLAMRAESEFNGILKRAAGYQPTETACKPGKTCAESCGAGYETCDDSLNPAPEFSFYCYNPSQGDICCSDRSGRMLSYLCLMSQFTNAVTRLLRCRVLLHEGHDWQHLVLP